MASNLLVFVETKGDKIKKTSLELLSEAKKIAGTLGGSVKGVMVGEGVSGLAPEAGAYGVGEVYVADHAGLRWYNPESYATLVADAVKRCDAVALLATAGSQGRDLLPKIAARLDSAMITECTNLVVKDGRIVGTRPIYAGKVMVDVTIPTGLQVISCRGNSFETAAPDSGKKAAVVLLDAASVVGKSKANIVERMEAKSDRPDVTEASIIVSGGRSLKSGENFKILQDLADVLGAAVGASRAAVDAGYVPHSIQVGQTGKTVNPQLYIACGISGAIQHIAGMRTSKVIVAINSDPDAPIFQISNYGIVGDLFKVVPLLTEEFRKILKE